VKPCKIYFLLGLAQKGGKIVSGWDLVKKFLPLGKIKLLIIAEDASDNTKNYFKAMCEKFNVPYCFYGNSYELGSSIGKEERKVIGIKDVNISRKILEYLGSHLNSEVGNIDKSKGI